MKWQVLFNIIVYVLILIVNIQSDLSDIWGVRCRSVTFEVREICSPDRLVQDSFHFLQKYQSVATH